MCAEPAHEPASAGGRGGVQPPGNLWTREGRWGRSHKRLQQGTMRGTPTPYGGTSKVGRRGSRPGGRARHRQDEVNWEGFRSGGLTLKPDITVCSLFPLLGPQEVSLGSSGGGRAAGVRKPCSGEGRGTLGARMSVLGAGLCCGRAAAGVTARGTCGGFRNGHLAYFVSLLLMWARNSWGI